MNYPTVAIHLNLNLLRIFRAAAGRQGFAATGTNILLGRQFEELVTNRQMRVIPSLGSSWPAPRFLVHPIRETAFNIHM